MAVDSRPGEREEERRLTATKLSRFHPRNAPGQQSVSSWDHLLISEKIWRIPPSKFYAAFDGRFNLIMAAEKEPTASSIALNFFLETITINVSCGENSVGGVS